ncbi:MAG: NAD(P)/FAD-dependent oxidoreductase, partial [bacterium]
MDIKTDVLIIGAGPAGMVGAIAAHRYYPDKKIVVLKNVQNGVIPCGIPYMFSSLGNPEDNKLGTALLEKSKIGVAIEDAVKIVRADKAVETGSGNRYFYEKLVIATGSHPMTPPIPGIDKEGIYPVRKEMDYLLDCIRQIKNGRNVLIMGGGFIGVEFADEISNMKGINVSLAEILPRLLANSFDKEFSLLAEERLKSKGVGISMGSRVVEFLGDKKVEGVRFENGKELAADNVILGIGAIPNTKLAEDAGLDLVRGKGIWVDEYMRTTDPDIFAIGDCAGKRDFYTRRDVPVMLASTAAAEARIAGANLYQLKVIRENKGTIAVYSTYIGGLVLGSAGLTENNARKEGFEIVTGMADGIDKHPAALPGTAGTKVKLVFAKNS